MPACAAGHDSAAADYCDVCGMRIGAATQHSAATQSAASRPAGPGAGEPAEPPGEPCPQCGAARRGQFCEGCGYDFAAGRPGTAPGPATLPRPDPPAEAAPEPAAAPGPGWTALVTADRSYFDSVIAGGGPDAATIEFPGYCPERRFALSGPEMRIGRRSVSRGLEPEIDLTGPPADPGISHLHAVLIAQPDGGWSVLDPGSSNGTQVNGAEIGTGVAVPLRAGDRICLGAWTMLTLQPR